MNNIIEKVKEYYGKELKSVADLKTSSCVDCGDNAPLEVKTIMPLIADEIKDRYYGCGSPIPPLLNGMTVLDLGCGTGRDVYIASMLVGENGHVIGIDMTTEQIETAIKYQEEQCERFGFSKTNTKFIQGYIEDLKSLGVEDNSVDVVISNCVINLSSDKEKVFKEIYRILKPGGELYFSDIFVDRRIPEDVANDPVIYGECLGGALYVEDFRRIMAKAGFIDFRYTATRYLDSDNEKLIEKLGFAKFSSRTIRAFKLDDLEDVCEDYGQVAYYDGSISGNPHSFDLDDHHKFITGKPMLVCGNTASMVSNTRYSSAFKVIGDRSVHFGMFDCTSDVNNTTETDSDSCESGSCC
ncbi:MAG: methyltransferase domain-containing protein [Oscillospiraceae bacterium]|jgi:SAM-dependent methyltransferase|nr:methyltransferase domain-containing protein [Oscillospiraceae bacterium]